jgi:prolyl oligopeptidase
MKPPSARAEDIVDLLHGQRVADPYRWLEDASSPETQAFVEQQNAYTRHVLDAVPGVDRAALRDRIEQLLTIGRVEPPHVAGDYYFYARRDGRQNQAVIYVRKGVDGQDRALIDVNALAQDGTIALDWFYPSTDGRYVAYGTSPSGTEISTLQIIETESARLLPLKVERTRAASLSWLPDDSGFYYTKYPRLGEVPTGQEVYNRRVFFHEISAMGNFEGLFDPQVFPSADITILPEHWPGVRLSEDGRWLLVKVDEGWSKSSLFLKDLSDPERDFVPLTTGKDFLYNADILDGHLYITTNEGATRYRVLKAPCSHPERENWKEIIPESAGVLEETQIIGGRLFLRYSRNAISELKIADLNGKAHADVSMPTLGSIFAPLGGKWDGVEAFFGFTSFAIPPTVYRVSLDGVVTPWAKIDCSINPNDFHVQQVWFTSKDGTRVPMFIVSKQGGVRTGKTPTLLSGYGGFNVGRTPVFNRNAMLLLLEYGGIYADVQLRGGNEFGEAWHRAGMLESKQNVFDDFSAAAEFLIRERYTDRDHLAIQGGSNGGLLVGAAITQRPELFRAAICQVPLLDMVRYHNFQIARLWIPEYGSADIPEQFKYIYSYSPYHHVKPGIQYPAAFFMTADGDTRVDPMHAIKMAALLQANAVNGPDRPILLRVDVKAGHGAGKPIGKLMDDALDLWTFLFWQLEINFSNRSLPARKNLHGNAGLHK